MKSLDFQAALSLNMIAFHRSRYNLLTSIQDPTVYDFSEDSKRIMSSVFDTIMRWNFSACQGMSQEKIKRLCHRLRETIAETQLETETYRVVFDKALDLYSTSITTCLTQMLGPTQLIMQDINSFIIQMMLHIRYLMHEIDNLINKREPSFISIDSFDLVIFNRCKQFMGIERLDLYNALHLFDDGITIKIYIEETASKDADTRASLEFMCTMVSERYDVLLIK